MSVDLWSGFPFLSAIVWLPLLGALSLLLLPSRDTAENHARVRSAAIVVSLATLALSLMALNRFSPTTAGYQLVESSRWIESLGVRYELGVDGVSMSLMLLTTILMPLVIIASHSVRESLRGYIACMLVLESAMLGTLVALDVFLFYVFWEFMLAPMYLIIGVWGGKRRIYASMKFVLYTVFGSVLMFSAILYTAWTYYEQSGSGIPSFNLADLLQARFTLHEQLWLFGAFALAMCIKVPLFPLHTWLPDAHVEAPTGGSVVLAGVLLKMGIYGLFRFAYPLFPDGADALSLFIAVLAVIGIIYGACVAWVQPDIKKLVAYSSVSHLGYCVLGLVAGTAVSVTGSAVQMINHGISTGALFLLVGVLYDRTHTRLIADYGGIVGKVPVFAFLFLVFTLSSIALPLTNGFVGEFMILSGSFSTFPLLTSIALAGVVLGAVYMLTLYMRTMYGEMNPAREEDVSDVSLVETLTLAPLLVLVFWIGLYPQPLVSLIEPSVVRSLQANRERSEQLKVHNGHRGTVVPPEVQST
jgi:NADH-quinone oxidoreductase subunit M